MDEISPDITMQKGQTIESPAHLIQTGTLLPSTARRGPPPRESNRTISVSHAVPNPKEVDQSVRRQHAVLVRHQSRVEKTVASLVRFGELDKSGESDLYCSVGHREPMTSVTHTREKSGGVCGGVDLLPRGRRDLVEFRASSPASPSVWGIFACEAHWIRKSRVPAIGGYC